MMIDVDVVVGLMSSTIVAIVVKMHRIFVAHLKPPKQFAFTGFELKSWRDKEGSMIKQ